jgi:two-component system cell cycle response regulator CtrA
MRLLLIEDNDIEANATRLVLEAEGFTVDIAATGEDGLSLARTYDFSLIILDVMLPDLEGHGVLRQLRDARIPTPVLMLSGLAELDHKIRGLGLGADDYLTKPFEREELVARIHAIVRRSQGHAQSQVDVGRLSIKMAERSAEVDGAPLALTGREYSVLELLALRKGATVNKEQFLTHLYGGVDEPDLKIIDVFVCKLRRKIAKATGGDHYIATEWGRGYILREPDSERAAS